MTDKIKLLHEQLTKAERRCSKIRAELNQIQRDCKHKFPGPPFYHGYGATPEGYTNFLDSETCVLCGLDCHDPEEWK